jgi:3-isopropylmalate/(R)-2-methylmalate dehydratase large subunit
VSGKTISEKILSTTSGQDARAGDHVVCRIDLAIGTDASSPMAIDYFEQMGGAALFDPSRVFFAMDHYAPPSSPKVARYHERMREFVARHGGELREVGEGISFQRAAELGRVKAGSLVIGADSHTVTLGALGVFATGVGSSDLAAALITGQVWLRVPETIVVRLAGERPPNVSAKDVALEMVRLIGPEGASYQTLELHGPALDALSLEDRLVLCNLGVEMGAKASIVPVDGVRSDPDARFVDEVVIDLSRLTPRVSLPHAPDRGVDRGRGRNAGAHGVRRNVLRRARLGPAHGG